MSQYKRTRVGAHFDKTHGTSFCVYAPFTRTVEIEIESPTHLVIMLHASQDGYFVGTNKNVGLGAKYRIKLDGNKSLPDPASRFQPDGVHGASQVVSSDFSWGDRDFKGIALDKLVVYELHIGTFTHAGNFSSAISDLMRIKNLGITAVELMPVAQFPGSRNWGYDGVYPFAVQNSYGGPHGLKQFVAAAHEIGLGVILDVVYNHLGPEGNYFSHYGPYFNDDYRTPWGSAINFDGPYSSEVRNYFLQNARQWFEEFHIDGLRLDAVHAIHDQSAHTFLEDLVDLKGELEKELNKSLLLIAESDANDSRLLRPRSEEHIGLDGQWSDDVHHAIHSIITGERSGYYEDFGSLEHFVKYLHNGVVYDGQYSKHRHRLHGRSYRGIDRRKLLVCAQNHDQIGNRPLGERLSSLVDERRQQLATALCILSPFTPILFMGEEYGETAPFLFFADHSDMNIIKATREGRQKEWGSVVKSMPIPDPFAQETFEKCRLSADRKKGDPRSQEMQTYYRELLSFASHLHKNKLWTPDAFLAELIEEAKILKIELCAQGMSYCLLFSFNEASQTINLPEINTQWMLVLGSQGNTTWQWTSNSQGEVAPFGVVVLKISGSI